MSTQCTSWPDFLVSLSPALCALLSAIALWVASRAHSTSKAAQSTSRALVETYAPRLPSSSVVLPPDVVADLRKRSSKD